MTWTPAEQFPALAGKSPEQRYKACRRALAGLPYKGQLFRVRKVPARGHHSGSWEIWIDDAALPARAAPVKSALPAIIARPQSFVFNDLNYRRDAWLEALLKPLRDHAPGSPDYRRARKALIGQTLPDWRGRSIRVTDTTLKRWEDNPYRKSRSDKGAKVTLVSLAFDAAARAAGASADHIRDWEVKATSHVRGMFRNRARYKKIQLSVSTLLLQITRDAGFTLPHRAFNIPRGFINRHPDAKTLGDYLLNRKKFEDENRYRIFRTIDGMRPCEVVIGDGNYIHFLLQRIDGMQRHARGSFWYDVGTKRVIGHVFLLPEGKGLTNQHVAASACHMMLEWGVPETLYLDNGSEYNFADLFKKAILCGVRRAQPYNGPAKQIEGFFSVFRSYIQDIPGYIGGDRTHKLQRGIARSSVGAFPGSFEDFCDAIQTAISIYNAATQGDGWSPNERYAAAINGGFKRTAIEPQALLLALAEQKRVKVRQNAVRVNGEDYRCPQGYGEVTAFALAYGRGMPIALELHNGMIATAYPVTRHHPLSPEGAREAGLGKAANKREMHDIDRNIEKIDGAANGKRMLRLLPPPPEAEIGETIALCDDGARVAQKLIPETAKQRREREAADVEEKRRLMAEQDARHVRLLERYKTTGT